MNSRNPRGWAYAEAQVPHPVESIIVHTTRPGFETSLGMTLLMDYTEALGLCINEHLASVQTFGDATSGPMTLAQTAKVLARMPR